MTSLEARALDLVAQLIELEPEHRDAMIESACAADPILQTRVQVLLAEYEAMPDGFLGGEDGALSAVPRELPDRIGAYRVLSVLGQGGMGVVYLAEQGRPARRVALKVIRPGYASPEQTKRFLYEAEVLGQLQHPGIAQVYEAGVAETPYGDQPYFAMELVEGPRLDVFAREQEPDDASKVELVAQICDAVHVAHTRGFVHRDLKPANILVVPPDGKHTGSRAKVLDFGVARGVGALDARSHHTQAGQLLGTLAYMSPEQVASGERAVDARSDVYALGVVLYELLSGRLPHDVSALALHDAADMIRHEEPTRLGVASPTLRGDLSTVVSKALEKEPERRYPSAAVFADDLRRVLRHEPVLARRPSQIYRLRKLTRRHRAATIGIVATVLSLVLGLTFTTHFAVQSAGREQIAMRETYRASLSAASAALRGYDAREAREHLERCPESLRGWEWRYLSARLDESIAGVPVVRNETMPWGPMCRIAYSADSDSILLVQRVTATGMVHGSWWDAQTLSSNGEWQSEIHQLTSIITPDATRVVLMGQEGPPRSLNGRSGDEADDSSDVHHLWSFAREHFSSIPIRGITFVFAPGYPLAAICAQDRIVLYDTERNKPLQELVIPWGAAAVTCSWDARRLIVAGRDRSLRVYDLADNARLVWSVERTHDDAMLAVALSHDGSLIATGSEDRTIRLWDAETGASRGRLLGHEYPVQALAFDADGRHLASSDSATLRRWDIAAVGEPFALRGHTNGVGGMALSPDGGVLVSVGRDIRLWDSGSLKSLGVAQAESDRGWISSKLLSCSFDGAILRVMTSAEGELMIPIGQFLPDSSDVTRTPSPAPEAERYRIDFSEKPHKVRLLKGDKVAREWTRFFRCAALSPDGRRIAIADLDTSIYDTRTGELICTLPGQPVKILALAFHPDGSRLASGSDDRVIRLWDLESRAEVMQLRGHLDRISDLLFTPDGKTLFSASGDHTVRAWTTRSAREVLANEARGDSRQGAGNPAIADLIRRLARVLGARLEPVSVESGA